VPLSCCIYKAESEQIDIKTIAALVFGMPESTREIVERRDKIRSQALNFPPLSNGDL